MRLQRKIVSEEILLLLPHNLSSPNIFFSPSPHLIVFHPAAELTSLAYYYNQLKLAREIALVKPVLAEVTICSHKHKSVSNVAQMQRIGGGWWPSACGDSEAGGGVQ